MFIFHFISSFQCRQAGKILVEPTFSELQQAIFDRSEIMEEGGTVFLRPKSESPELEIEPTPPCVESGGTENLMEVATSSDVAPMSIGMCRPAHSPDTSTARSSGLDSEADSLSPSSDLSPADFEMDTENHNSPSTNASNDAGRSTSRPGEDFTQKPRLQDDYTSPTPDPGAPKAKQTTKKPGAPKAKGAVRAKSGCYTCRIRRKVNEFASLSSSSLITCVQKCDGKQNQDGHCETCVRLRLQCLGFGVKRPEWLRESRNVTEMRDKIKSFLAQQGMIKGHSGAAHRGSEQVPILQLDEDSTPSSSVSPPTPTLSLTPSEPAQPLLHESAMRDQHWIGVANYSNSTMHNPMRGASPFEGSSHSSHPDKSPPSYKALNSLPYKNLYY
ncbi:C6 finger domain transcription factor nosA [Mycena sanguinolenta]|uniref:C6 finger domain transcription factor nosA n=1 Tax=Mycena sanguinolenta TaxID=230812 RepID=A0A8H6ZFB6_9AGAR|nr:C6 finger domain transcription factor nosA [Mycena sanguinolenta]